MTNQTNKMPIWFWIIAVIALLWNIMGVFSFFFHSFPTQEYLSSLPDNERALYNQFPLWTKLVFFVATFSGLLGAIGLILKKRWAKLKFVISMFAIIPQMIQNVFITDSIEVYGAVQAAMMPIIVFALGAFFIWFADYCNKKYWL